jgi:hypothetical protein
MTTTTLYYRIPDICAESRFRLETEGAWDVHDVSEQKIIAQEAAKEYHARHYGWESSWPLVIALHATEEGPEVARFSVHREMEPVFYAGNIVTVRPATHNSNSEKSP